MQLVTGAPVDPPHPNGAVHESGITGARRARRRIFLGAGIVLVGLWIFAIIWSVTVTSKSPERLDDAAAAAVAAACAEAREQLRSLPLPSPRAGADRVARIRAENDALRAMIVRFRAVEPTGSTPARALDGWSSDWEALVDARARYADDLQSVAGSDDKVQFEVPAATGVKPVTERMDDFVRENNPDLDDCYAEALEAEQVEGERDYEDVDT
jgi:hypothetical protein